ncbi:MAG TPA: D-alanyl-D-alanine carboxypeptidase/D-alanyl-D-alanine-endopeptidase [Candidatus Aquabacterium excrementipullorum]|nr:D-alanyl-D-alanine carboxypeptidase/D-alanyl-D-alanine-endopeptidase [Candidatus Aquabacterium excrementipullorum]
MSAHVPPGRRPRGAATLLARWTALLPSAAALLGGQVLAQPLPPPFTATGTVSSAGTPPSLPEPIAQALIDSGLPISAVSLWVQGVDSDRPRLALQGDTPRQMASVMKLLTTGVALRTLGPAYRWHTAAALDGRLDAQGVLRGNVHLKASGDPSMDAMRLAEALRTWRAAGLREIRGDVVVDRSLFALPSYDAAAFDGQPLKPYNAGADAWLLAHGAASLTLRPDPASPGGVRVGLNPPLAGVALDARLTLDRQSPCGDWREALQLSIDPAPASRRTVHLRGRYPAACQDQAWPLRWPQATEGEHSARVFEAAWQEAGGRLRGQVRDGAWPASPTPWLDWVSPPLAEVVRDINKFSNNVMARQLFLTLGLDPETGHATLEGARTQVTAHVREATRQNASANPCEGNALQMDNGSGLSRVEVATAHCMARWVQVMWADPMMPEWLASLPVAGVDGTARRMAAGTGRAHLKTGSLEGAASIAGVVQDDKGRRWVVVAVVNDPRAGGARGVLQATVGWAASGAP